LLSLPHSRVIIVNPATRQWLALPRLTGTAGKIVGLYPNLLRSGEYCILFWRSKYEVRKSGYYVLTVGSSHNQKPKYIGLPVATPYLHEDKLAVVNYITWHPLVLLNGCLHWVMVRALKDRLLIFDTVEQTFRSLGYPSAQIVFPYLLRMEETLGLNFIDESKGIMKLWVLQDYDREAWSFKCQIEVPMVGHLDIIKFDVFSI
jgi:F-box interacting protein